MNPNETTAAVARPDEHCYYEQWLALGKPWAPQPISALLEGSPGLYGVGDERHPDHLVPVYKDGAGRIWSMTLDSALAADRWQPDAVVYGGPIVPQASPAVRVESARRAVQERDTVIERLLMEARDTMRWARVFIASREKMHPAGVQLWDSLLGSIERALAGTPHAPTRDSERAALVAEVGDCCNGGDPLCAGGCLVEKAIRKRAGTPHDTTRSATD